jgi:peroxiredoxin
VSDSQPAAGPAIGTEAPDFTLPDQHGSSHHLADLRGKRILLVFYPYAFTGTCTGEMAALSANADRLRTDSKEVFAISCDPVPALRVFDTRYDIGIPLLSDFWPHGAVASAYDAFDPARGSAVRASYVVDATGHVAWTVRSGLREARDIEESIAALTGA